MQGSRLAVQQRAGEQVSMSLPQLHTGQALSHKSQPRNARSAECTSFTEPQQTHTHTHSKYKPHVGRCTPALRPTSHVRPHALRAHTVFLGSLYAWGASLCSWGASLCFW